MCISTYSNDPLYNFFCLHDSVGFKIKGETSVCVTLSVALCMYACILLFQKFFLLYDVLFSHRNFCVFLKSWLLCSGHEYIKERELILLKEFYIISKLHAIFCKVRSKLSSKILSNTAAAAYGILSEN